MPIPVLAEEYTRELHAGTHTVATASATAAHMCPVQQTLAVDAQKLGGAPLYIYRLYQQSHALIAVQHLPSLRVCCDPLWMVACATPACILLSCYE